MITSDAVRQGDEVLAVDEMTLSADGDSLTVSVAMMFSMVNGCLTLLLLLPGFFEFNETEPGTVVVP